MSQRALCTLGCCGIGMTTVHWAGIAMQQKPPLGYIVWLRTGADVSGGQRFIDQGPKLSFV